MTPILKYPGAKWRLMPRLLPYVPRRGVRRVLDAYCGSGAFGITVQEAIEPAHLVLNDRDGRIASLFQVLRDPATRQALIEAVALTPWSRDEYLAVTTQEGEIVATGEPVEDARRFLILTWQQHGTKLDRRGGWRHKGTARSGTYELWAKLPDRLALVAEALRHAEIESLPALTLIGRYNTADTLIYADPPYMRRSPQGVRGRMYRWEMSPAEHAELLAALQAHPGPALISGYRCQLYDERLADWRRVDLPAAAEHGQARIESLWLNREASSRLGAPTQLTLSMDTREEQANDAVGASERCCL